MVTTRRAKSQEEVVCISPNPEDSSSRKNKHRKSSQKNLSARKKRKNEYPDDELPVSM